MVDTSVQQEDLSVAIGGNVRGEPMSDESWEAFQGDIREDLADTVGSPTYEVHGNSEWKGIPERTAVFHVVNPPLGTDQVEALRKKLHNAVSYMGQDAIALTIGETELIDGSRAYECHICGIPGGH